MKRWNALVIAGLVTTVTACSSGGRNIPRTGNGTPASWIGGTNTWELILSLTRSGSALSGSADTVTLNGTSTTPAHAAVTGTVDGTAVTLTFTGGLFTKNTFSGTLDTNTLTLQSPSTTGQIQLITLHPGSIDIYNQAVGALQSEASANASASASASASQASASQASAAAASESQRISDDTASFWKAVDDANTAMAKGYDFSDFDRALSQAQQDLKQAKSDAAKAANEPDQASACSDAVSAGSDAISVSSDQLTVQSLVTTFNQAETGFSDTIDQVPELLRQYQQDSPGPNYMQTNPPTQGAADDITRRAKPLVDGWNKRVSDYSSSVQSLLDQANSASAAAKKIYCTN